MVGDTFALRKMSDTAGVPEDKFEISQTMDWRSLTKTFATENCMEGLRKGGTFLPIVGEYERKYCPIVKKMKTRRNVVNPEGLMVC